MQEPFVFTQGVEFAIHMYAIPWGPKVILPIPQLS